jgi:hypothetical protein
MSKQTLISLNPVWTNYAQGLQNSRFIADQVFPILSVTEDEKSGRIPLVSDENFELSKSKRAPHSATPVVNGNPITGFAQYSAELDVLAYGIDITERKGKVIDLIKHGTMVVAEKVLINREIRTANLVRAAANYTNGNTAAVTNKWNVTGTSDPLADLETAFGVIETNVGDVARKIVMGGKAWRSFKNHPVVKSALSSGMNKVITPEIAAELLEVDQVIIGRSVYKDPATGNRIDIWSDDVIVFGSAPPQGQRTLYTSNFGWTPAVAPYDRGPGIDTYNSEDGLIQYVRASTWEDSLFHGAKMGYLLRDVNS